MTEHKTVGEIALKASQDTNKYDALEVGHALVEDNSILNGLEECIQRHNKIFDEDEYFVCYVIASDPLIRGVMRRKFFGYLYLPSPRPEQTVFLYSKKEDRILKRLWVLPPCWSPNERAWTMEKLYKATWVPKEYESMKRWSMAFYDGHFWETIRKEHNIDNLSESEYLQRNREKLLEAGCKVPDASFAEPFDFGKVSSQKIVNA